MKKFIFGIVLGAGAGAAGMYFWSKSHFQKIFEEAYKTSENTEEEEVDKEDKIQVEESKDDELSHSPSYMSGVHTEKPDLDKYSKVIKENGYSAESEATPEPAPKKKTSTKNKPKLITYDEYNNEENYMTEVLKYYEEEDVITDFDDMVIDAVSIIGEAGVDALLEADDHIYVRNPKNKTVYDVEIIHGSREESIY